MCGRTNILKTHAISGSKYDLKMVEILEYRKSKTHERIFSVFFSQNLSQFIFHDYSVHFSTVQGRYEDSIYDGLMDSKRRQNITEMVSTSIARGSFSSDHSKEYCKIHFSLRSKLRWIFSDPACVVHAPRFIVL